MPVSTRPITNALRAVACAALLACAPLAAAEPVWARADELTPTDTPDTMGRYFDTHTIPAPVSAGQWVIAKVTTRGFDPIVEVQIGEQRIAVDDAHGSRLVAIAHVPVAAAAADFKVVVSSWKEGATGAYTVEVEVRDDYAWFGLTPIAALVPNAAVAGYLDNTDPVVNERHVEVYSLAIEPMQFYDIVVDAGLDAGGRPRFDPVLHALVANGQELFSDDAIEAMPDGAIATRVDRSHIRFFSPAAERMTLAVRAFRPATGGPYTIRVTKTTPRLFAVAAGFDEYLKSSPLSDCSADARRVIDALRLAGLQDDNAALINQASGVQAVDLHGNHIADTRDAILSALHDFGARMGPYDLLVFFYSGHGGRVPAAALDPTDPDGYTEYLALPEGTRLDDSQLGQALPARGRVLVVLDACFSGGFARDTIDRPGRAGIFACTEDATSLVWRGFGGGYLAPLLEEALSQRGRFGGSTPDEFAADSDADGVLTLAELSLYLQRRYRQVIDRGAAARPPATPSLDLDRYVDSAEFPGWQHLVIDRAGLGAFDPLLVWK